MKFYRVSVLELDGSYLSLILKTENLSYAANKDQCWNTKRKKEEEDHAVWPPLPILLECPQGDPAPKWHQLEAVRLGILAASTSILSSFPISMDDASCFHQRELTFVVFITGSSSTGMICALKSPAFTMGPVASGICLCSHHRVLSLMSVDLIVTHSDFCDHHLGWIWPPATPLQSLLCQVIIDFQAGEFQGLFHVIKSIFQSRGRSLWLLEAKVLPAGLASLPPLSPVPTPASQPVFTKSSLLITLPCSGSKCWISCGSPFLLYLHTLLRWPQPIPWL